MMMDICSLFEKKNLHSNYFQNLSNFISRNNFIREISREIPVKKFISLTNGNCTYLLSLLSFMNRLKLMYKESKTKKQAYNRTIMIQYMLKIQNLVLHLANSIHEPCHSPGK